MNGEDWERVDAFIVEYDLRAAALQGVPPLQKSSDCARDSDYERIYNVLNEWRMEDDGNLWCPPEEQPRLIAAVLEAAPAVQGVPDERPRIRTFVGYRPKVPEHYVEGGYGNDADEPQYQGVEFDDGTVAVRWLTQFRSTSIWPNFAEFEAVHGHPDYGTKIVWSAYDRALSTTPEDARSD